MKGQQKKSKKRTTKHRAISSAGGPISVDLIDYLVSSLTQSVQDYMEERFQQQFMALEGRIKRLEEANRQGCKILNAL